MFASSQVASSRRSSREGRLICNLPRAVIEQQTIVTIRASHITTSPVRNTNRLDVQNLDNQQILYILWLEGKETYYGHCTIEASRLDQRPWRSRPAQLLQENGRASGRARVGQSVEN